MTTAHELIMDGRTEEFWQKCCGYIDLSIDQFMTIQNQLLLEQIELLKKCELGQKLMRGVAPQSVTEFRREVPLTTYASYVPYLPDKNEDALPAKPVMWQRTSGRSDEFDCKWVPLSERAYEELGDVFMSLLLFASCNQRNHVALKARNKFLYGLAAPPYASGCWALRAERDGVFDWMPPLAEAQSMEFRQRIEVGFRQGMAEGIDMMGAISSVLVAIGERFGQGGGMGRVIPLLNQPRMLMRLLKAVLKSKLARRPLMPRDIWTLRGLLSGGADASVYRHKIKELWGREPLDVYAAAESSLIATQTWDYGDMTFIPNLSFYEFLTEEEYAKWAQDHSYQPPTRLLDEVSPGERYGIVITSFHGGAFVRYVLGDILTITSSRNEQLNINLPQMVFYGRADDIIDFAAFTHAFFTEKSTWQAIHNTGIDYVDWVARKEAVNEAPLLHIYIELKEEGSIGEEQVTELLHREIAKINKDYEDLERFFGFRPLKVTLLPGGSFAEYMARQKEAGADLAHIKPPHMSPSDSVMNALLGKEMVTALFPADTSKAKLTS